LIEILEDPSKGDSLRVTLRRGNLVAVVKVFDPTHDAQPGAKVDFMYSVKFFVGVENYESVKKHWSTQTNFRAGHAPGTSEFWERQARLYVDRVIDLAVGAPDSRARPDLTGSG